MAIYVCELKVESTSSRKQFSGSSQLLKIHSIFHNLHNFPKDSFRLLPFKVPKRQSRQQILAEPIRRCPKNSPKRQQIQPNNPRHKQQHRKLKLNMKIFILQIIKKQTFQNIKPLTPPSLLILKGLPLMPLALLLLQLKRNHRPANLYALPHPPQLNLHLILPNQSSKLALIIKHIKAIRLIFNQTVISGN